MTKTTSKPSFAHLQPCLACQLIFLGQQVYEVVRPLVSLLHTDKEGAQNYEALRGLTNLAAYSEKLR